MSIRILITVIQLIGILVPFAGCISLIRRAQSRTSMYLLLANLGCLIVNGSYMLLLQTKTEEGALVALKMEYFGNVVFYLTFGLFLWSYLKLKRHKWTKILLAAWCIQDIIFLLSIWNTNGLHFVFKSLSFQWNEKIGLVLIQSAPGVLYILRYSTMCIILLCGILYTTIRMFLIKIPSERSNLAKLAGAQFVICASLVFMLFYSIPFDIVPICASLSILSIIISVARDEFFGITELGQQWVFDQMGDAFIIVDEMYGYLDSNPYAKKVFPELNSKRKNEAISKELYQFFKNKEKIQKIQGKHYNKKIMELREKGELAGYSLLLSDVTEQYELMERVKEEKERADAANQAKSAFVSNISHEIRTPMNAIVGITQIMLRKELSQQDRDYLMNIQSSGNALLAMINDLLDLSKVESGKMEIIEEEYNLMPILSDLGMIILNRIGNKPVELLFDIDPELPTGLCGDALRIRQIIINLMNNAAKFTEEGSICLTVKIKGTEQDNIELYISVKDTGQGIRKEDLGKLFGSFQQVDSKKNHHKEGTGLGLSISKQLVELMHGSIGVTSEYGKGSEFYFTIRQKVADWTKAARLSDSFQAVITGNMKNNAAKECLEKLSRQYKLSYTESILSVKPSGLPVFYFTDQYEALSEEEKRKLSSLDAVVCGMQNPMAENHFPETIVTINKPLYSYNFCHFLENLQEPDEKAALAAKTKAETKPEENETNFSAPEACILIVDDNEINRMIAEEMLKPLDMQIETASDGKQALDMIQTQKYDLVFMDHLMPVMDGIEAVKAIRMLNGSYYKNLPVIALTANTAKEQQQEYRQAGMNDHLAKPIDMAELYKKIRKWIPDKICIANNTL